MLRINGGALLLIALLCYNTSGHFLNSSLYTRMWTLPKNGTESLVQGTLFATDSHNFPYATCKITKPNVEKTCNVMLVNPNKPDRMCTGIKIFSGGDDRELFLGGYFALTPFSANHVAVGWWDLKKESLSAPEKDHHLKFSILDMTTCKIANLDFSIDKVAYGFFPAKLTYSNQFDMILNSKKSCAGADKCRLSFDLDGKQIGGVKPYLPKVSQYASPVSATSPAKGFFQYVKDLSSISVLFINSASEGKEVLNVKFEEQKGFKHDVFSNAYELYSICWTPSIGTKNPTAINCSQFDAIGRQTLSKNITFPQLLNWVAVRNLPNSGILLATGGCEKTESSDKGCKNFHVYRFNESGQQSKTYELEAPDHECRDITTNLEVRISEDYDKDEFCFDFSCLPSPTNLKFSSKCVPKKELLN